MNIFSWEKTVDMLAFLYSILLEKKLTFKNKLTLFIEVKGVTTAPVSRKIHTSQKYLGYSLTLLQR